jgi:hypothetical protein
MFYRISEYLDVQSFEKWCQTCAAAKSYCVGEPVRSLQISVDILGLLHTGEKVHVSFSSLIVKLLYRGRKGFELKKLFFSNLMVWLHGILDNLNNQGYMRAIYTNTNGIEKSLEEMVPDPDNDMSDDIDDNGSTKNPNVLANYLGNDENFIEKDVDVSFYTRRSWPFLQRLFAGNHFEVKQLFNRYIEEQGRLLNGPYIQIF